MHLLGSKTFKPDFHIVRRTSIDTWNKSVYCIQDLIAWLQFYFSWHLDTTIVVMRICWSSAKIRIISWIDDHLTSTYSSVWTRPNFCNYPLALWIVFMLFRSSNISVSYVSTTSFKMNGNLREVLNFSRLAQVEWLCVVAKQIYNHLAFQTTTTYAMLAIILGSPQVMHHQLVLIVYN